MNWLKSIFSFFFPPEEVFNGPVEYLNALEDAVDTWDAMRIRRLLYQDEKYEWDEMIDSVNKRHEVLVEDATIFLLEWNAW